MNVYNKRGNPNPKEKKYVRKLNKLLKEHPELESEIKPANTFEELEELYNKHCVETVEHTETIDPKEKELDEILGEGNKDSGATGTEPHQDPPVVDAWAKDDPIIRDYVGKEGFKKDEPKQQTSQTSFAEPTSFKDAFEIPGEEQGQPGSDGKPKPPKPEPVNPQFDSMNAAVRNRKTKRMAKNIVNGFCYLIKEGIPFLLTKDITPAALANAAKQGKLDLSIILTFDGETQIHIMQFFKQMCEQAKTIGDIPKELQEELIEDLYEVLLEKKITPTPMQSLMMTMGEIAMLIGFKAIGFRMQISQVKALAAPAEKQKPASRPAPPPQQEAAPPPPPVKEEAPQAEGEFTSNGKGKKESAPAVPSIEVGEKVETKE